MLANQESGSPFPKRNQSQPVTRRSHALRRRAAHRRSAGVILLVVLVLLALFTMLLISFVVATVSHRQGVMQGARTEQTGDSPQAQLYGALMQVVRGSRDSNSVMSVHSLLEDEYGHNAGQSTPSQYGVRGTILPGTSGNPDKIGYMVVQLSGGGSAPLPYLPDSTANSPVNLSTYAPTPILAFTANISNDPFFPKSTDLAPYGYYNGRLITMITGPAAGRTGQIVGYYYNYNNSTNYFQVLGFDGIVPNPGDTFLINGRAFSGTGFGFNPSSFVSTTTNTRLLDACLPSPPYPLPSFNPASPATQPGFQYALLPNPRRGVFEPVDTGTPFTSYLDPAGPGGANEDYDAPDFQNMLLAMRVWADPTLSATYVTSNYQLMTLLPSLHRPDLMMYWNTRWKATLGGSNNYLFPTSAVSSANPYDALTFNGNQYFVARNLLRKISLRPLSIQDDASTATVDESENPNFTGSNPNYDPIQGGMPGHLWDVDNDGDGIPDSVWVDLGMPVQQSPDGRRYKPLFAILCVDMDGKLNLNAHSNIRHCPPSASAAPSRFSPVNAPFAMPTLGVPVPMNTANQLRVGSGYGPPEISLHPIFEPGWNSSPAAMGGSVPLATPTGELRKTLSGDSVYWIEGRNGELELTGTALSVPPGVGITWLNDPMNWLRESSLSPTYNWRNWSQHQYPYLPVNFSPTAPQFPIPFFENPTMWSGGKWAQGYGSAYGSPPDLDGDGMIALDLRGQPMYLDYPSMTNLSLAGDAGWGEPDEAIDDPYELDLSLNAANDGYSQSTWGLNWPNGLNGAYIVSVDEPFTPAELERILRWRDSDAPSLPNRILRLAPIAMTNPAPSLPSDAVGRFPYYPELAQIPSLLTTHSFDLPVPSMVFASPDLEFTLYYNRTTANRTTTIPPILNSHITQLLAARIRAETLPYNATFNADLAISQLLAPELIAGEKMNINRTLGNGYDDNGNGIIDEPGETEGSWAALSVAAPTAGWQSPTGVAGNPVANTNPGTNGFPLDLNNDGQANNNTSTANTIGTMSGGVLTAGDDMKARQLFARHIYVLLSLLADHVPTPTVQALQATGDYDGDGLAGQPADTPYYLAQWAVNIVDFMDGDSIMTPFEFDINPFKNDDATPNTTWDVDGIINPVGGAASPDDASTWRGLVWGCERPELLITETLATHDRGTADSKQGTGGAGKGQFVTTINGGTNPNVDADFDQVRRPRGTLMVELFNPNPPFTIGNRIGGMKPSELYNQTATTDNVTGAARFGVDLAKLDTFSSQSPVWRLATFRNNPAVNPTLPPDRMPTLLPKQIDRIVYFTSGSPAITTTEFSSITTYQPPQFYLNMTSTAGTPNTIIPPNTYAMIGPAAADPYGTTANLVTGFGIRDRSTDVLAGGSTIPQGATVTSIKNNYLYRITLGPNILMDGATGGIYNTFNPAVSGSTTPYLNPYHVSNPTQTDMKQTLWLPISTLYFSPPSIAPIAPTNLARSIRMSVSEPDRGYPMATSAITSTNIANVPNANYNDNAYYTGGIPDTPYDFDSTLFTSDPFRQTNIKYDGTNGPNPTTPTTYVYLQRLANPDQPWEANTNPYIIVDKMPVDLTAFNGEKSAAATPGPASEPGLLAAGTLTFDSRRRGDIPHNYNLYSQATTAPTGAGTLLQPCPLASPGFLNRELVNLTATGAFDPTTGKWWWTSSDTNIIGSSIIPTAEYRGDPRIPFPWLTWNDRPYVSSKELMLVPFGSPSSMFSVNEMSLGLPFLGTGWPGQTSVNNHPYEHAGQPNPPSPMGEYGHLANVFDSPQYVTTMATSAIPRQEFSPNFYRLLEYVHVPSRFTGTDTWLPPQKMMGYFQDPNAGTDNPNNLPVHSLHPPFNRVSRLRDPGKVNINTILDPFVWQGVIDDSHTSAQVSSGPSWVNLWNAVCLSRLGTVLPAGVTPTESSSKGAHLRADLVTQMVSATPNLPSIFSNPFRSYGSHTLVPLDAMRRDPTSTASPQPEREIDATLLRTMPNTSTPANYPLFEYPGTGSYSWYETTAPIDDQYRNPYFAYKAFRRLDNLLTTRSNVYSVWITVGYFEVTPAPSNDPQRSVKYPDGWVLGQEVGADTGDIQRHRAFYMYDRSIPVGFERGENHNVNKGILLERFIE
ncbi:MAG TPA: hypothetical protein VGN12_14995 [Pirellulales bacterium]|jgi:hypothetical protein